MGKLTLLLFLTTPLWFASAQGMIISSKNFNNGGNLKQNQIANAFGCHGKNLSPELSWIGIPKTAKSLAISAYDPDAPTGSGFWHWIVYDINVHATSINDGASNTSNMPDNATEASNDSGTKGYIGACPPKGDNKHRYQFTIYAIDVNKLPIPANATSPIIRFILNKHVISKATITAYAQTE
jgi:Raf kinase inhibitor-like YbhB/YbcL family protein